MAAIAVAALAVYFALSELGVVGLFSFTGLRFASPCVIDFGALPLCCAV